MKRRLDVAIGGAVIGVAIFLFALSLAPAWDERATVLLVGDLESESSFAVPIAQAFARHSALGATSARPFLIEPVHVPEFKEGVSESQLAELLRSKLTRRFASKNVVAIVSANTTRTARVTISVSAAFRVPALLIVATNDDLLNGTSSTLRLVPRDSLQASAISDWLNTTCPDKVVHVLYDDSAYGRDLKEKITATAKCSSLTSVLSTTSNFPSVVEASSSAKVSTYVLLTYPDQARAFVKWLRALEVTVPVVMSDGGVGEWLTEATEHDEQIFVCFPDTSLPRDFVKTKVAISGDEGGFGYVRFGEDAITLISQGIVGARSEGLGKVDLARAICDQAAIAGTLLRYRFDASGENTLARFCVRRARDVLHP